MENASAATRSDAAPRVTSGSRVGLWLGVAVVVLILAGGVWFFVRQTRLSRARNDVALIALALEGFARENGKYPAGTTGEVGALLRGDDVAGQNPHKLDYLTAEVDEVNAAGEFVDPWGTPYRISTNPRGRAYSCGPNRVDEQGHGDDIASGP